MANKDRITLHKIIPTSINIKITINITIIFLKNLITFIKINPLTAINSAKIQFLKQIISFQIIAQPNKWETIAP